MERIVEQPKLIKYYDAAKYLNLSVNTLRQMVSKGNISCKKIGSCVRFTMDILNNYKNNKEKKNIGYVYLIKCNKYYKIGKTFDINERFNAIKAGIPYRVYLWHYEVVHNMHAVESTLHRIYKTKRIKGEWFKLNDLDVFNVIRELIKNQESEIIKEYLFKY